MKRFTAILASAAALSALGAVSATEATAQVSTATTATKTCVYGFEGILRTQLCATVDGDQVWLSGYATPVAISWTPQTVSFDLTAGVVGGASLGTDTPNVVIPVGGRPVGYVAGTAPCGSTVTGTFSVTKWGWPPSTATVSVPVPC
ncbi:hypothetical protein [Kitasatospora sp. NPDC002965]|uniref:hypothetical protein n=1 Tax=Kitasatospora sp. NPDC002965 TaxID=3154775 RepID=UPI0033A83426